MKKKILIIEDDEFLRMLIAKKFIGEEFEVVRAIDGRDGLEKIEKEKPDLVLLDLVLPGMDGFEVLEKIKNGPMGASTPVIVLSNLGQQKDIDKAKELGAIDYLIKSNFDSIEIVEKVRKIFK